jgi:hypothetical protein
MDCFDQADYRLQSAASPLAFPGLNSGGVPDSLAYVQGYVQGVRTGMQVRQMETAALTRLGIVIAIGFGAITFFRHYFSEAQSED